MASIIPRDQKLRKPFSKPMMLKDYLRDDLSSCSSNGFKSLPRRQCCTTVRFLLEVDLKAAGSKSTITKRLLYRSRSSKAASTTISALQRASEAVINAAKQLPFRSGKSSSSPSVQNTVRKGLLTRSLSQKLFRKSSFWRKADDDHNKEETDVRRWRLFREILEEQDKPSDQNTHNPATIIVPTRVSTSASSNSNSWAESEFTSVILRSSSGNSESLSENDVVEGKKKLPEKKVSERVGVTAGEDSILGAATTYCGDNTKEWPNEEKEQFSPVSVLDCPFEDYDEEVSSPLQGNLALVEGTKQKLMHKIRRFECLAQLEPVDLEKRIVLSEFDHEAADLQSPMQRACSMSDNTFDNKEGNQTQQKAQELLDLVKTKGSPNGFKFKADRLLSDFFRERIEEKNENGTTGCNEYCEDELLKVAEDWITGNQQELLLGWEVEEGRKIYVRDMEKGGRWSILVEEKEEVALEVEVEVWTSLLNELLLDLF